ncbi:MAG: hypothetical protein ABII76_09695 [Pseudomonadota bacterium]|uniref:hypothetical protein n=1 Tax=Roseixanthobacter finlandensis TaxID=3119922 RepID=UPI0037294F82
MNRIVREHYPVEKLPEDLRESVTSRTTVRVVLEDDIPAAASAGHFTKWQNARRSHFESSEEIVAHVRALRDEWDRR